MKVYNELMHEERLTLISEPTEERHENSRYTIENYPRFIANHGNWDIYANDNGHCAAIPTKNAAADGCRPSYFGNLNYVKVTLAIKVN